MSSRSELTRNNIRTGVFVSVAIVLAVSSIVAVSGARERYLTRYHDYIVSYPVLNGVGALARGSTVRVGGMVMGEVLAVRPISVNGHVLDLEVDFKLNDTIVLYENPEIVVNTAMIGSESWLDIRKVGTGDVAWPNDQPISGYEASAMLSSVLGHEGAKQAGNFVEFLGDIRAEYQARVVPTLTNLDEATADIRAVTSDLNDQRWGGWADAVDGVALWAGDFTTQLDAAIADGRELVGSAQETVEENRPAIRDTLENTRDATAHVNEESLARLDALLEYGGAALKDAAQVADSLGRDYDQWATEFGHTMANATLASQQLKLATIEVRRSPWKILYRPGNEELSHELLYESARSFAMAAADLRATTDAIQRITDRHGTDFLETDASFQRLVKNLDGSVTRYEEAQQKFLDVITEDVTSRE